MSLLRVVPHQNFSFCDVDCGSTIALDLQQKLNRFLHSSQQQIAIRFLLGIYSFFRGVEKFSVKFA